jgi:hypothetical protein
VVLVSRALSDVGVKLLRRHGAAARELLVPAPSLASYKSLVRERLNSGFWNEVVGSREILFIFKLADSTSSSSRSQSPPPS